MKKNIAFIALGAFVALSAAAVAAPGNLPSIGGYVGYTGDIQIYRVEMPSNTGVLVYGCQSGAALRAERQGANYVFLCK